MPDDEFKSRLKIAKNKAEVHKDQKDQKSSSSMGTAFKMSTELVSAVAVGTIIGFILDNWFGTKPWLILIFFFVGVAAGIMNVVKTAKKMQK
tara:strand:- start:2417 stop:2692 length:276 start_codon:yes stop_codon:yes gene_type:complete